MRPFPTRRSADPGAADQATTAGDAPVGENDRDATRVTAEIQAPPPAGPPQQPAGTPTRVDTPQIAAPDPLAAASAGPAERGKLRRRLRRLKRVRARQLADLGTLVVDARKRGNGSHPEVVERRAAEAAEVDRQVRDLAHAVNAHADKRELATGVAGTCTSCGELLSTEDRFCPTCGTPTKPGRKRPADPAPEATRDAPVVPPPPAGGALAHVDRSAIPPPPLPPPLPAAMPPAPAEPAPPAPPAPPADAPLAHVDPSSIPPPPPPATPQQ